MIDESPQTKTPEHKLKLRYKILIGIVAVLILYLLLVAVYNAGVSDGENSIKKPFILLSYIDKNLTNCTEPVKDYFIEDDVKTFIFNETYATVLPSFNLNIDSSEWLCSQDSNYGKNPKFSLCVCSFVGDVFNG